MYVFCNMNKKMIDNISKKIDIICMFRLRHVKIEVLFTLDDKLL